MNVKKIIPCLDMKNGNVVKGINFVNIQNVGNPINLAKKYCNDGADELVFLDIAATNEERKIRKDLIEKICENITIPLTVGGGIKSLDDIEEVIEAGASKVGINSAGIKNKKFLKDAIEKFGSDKIVLAIDGKKEAENKWNVMINGGEVNTQVDAVEWAKEAVNLGVKEILLTSLDQDGVKKGYDLDLTKMIKDVTGVNVIASGGCGNMDDIYEVLSLNIADSALAASVFHYDEINIKDLKIYLKSKGIELYSE
ncbi:MAG: imidazole glycerol phosphate synthase subunit HisF [Sarcina sp.]